MNRRNLIMVLLTILSLPALAQEPAQKETKLKPSEMAEKMTYRMAERLELDEDQQKELLKANLEMAKFRAEQQRMAMEKKDIHEQKLKTILTEEQFQEYQQAKERMRKRAQERKRKHRPRGSVR